MKLTAREFTRREKILLLALAIIVLVLLYFRFVDMPVRAQLEKAAQDKESLSVQLQLADAKIGAMRNMQKEMDAITESGTASMMSSYNNSTEEMRILNDVLVDARQYSVSFDKVTRDGDQIRRSFDLQFTVDSYEDMEKMIAALEGSKCRCLIGDVRCSRNDKPGADNNFITVNTSATFYETMVGGTPDAGLPE